MNERRSGREDTDYDSPGLDDMASRRQGSDDRTEPNGTAKEGKDVEKGGDSSGDFDFEQSVPPETARFTDRIAHFTW